ncbi:unnamed protein product [Euphydryas editha]|uniref:Uncharacterized protein n=1 Tax=Euphydryas editha TaxID=104508 RepID=A0AAU9UR98_EUPED|nr:unnamed protein product [Euphydryas editha]
MSRCDNNVLFFRVLCATLLATTITFTVILTNVFIDIDWFLSTNKPNTRFTDTAKITANEYKAIEGTETDTSDDDQSYYNEVDPFYRTKRSIESENIPLHVKDPGLKKILTNRLASLLKELDEEEVKNEEIKPETTTVDSIKNFEKMLLRNNVKNGIRKEDLLHLAMHNILLQGMIGHMDLNDVYKKVHILVNNFNNVSNDSDVRNARTLDTIVNSKEDTETRKLNQYNDEHKFFEELIKCKKLGRQIANNKQSDIQNSSKSEDIEKDSKVYIKAVIEINEGNKMRNKINLANSTENVEGLIRLMYNGKPIKVNQVKETTTPNIETKKIDREVELITDNYPNKNIEELETNLEVNDNNKQKQNLLLNKLIEEYMKTHSPKLDYLEDGAEIKNIKTKRLKRQIKIRYVDDKLKNKPKILDENTKLDDDNVYIEIETHFDGKGVKGEKKKKLVRSLIDKIEKALNSNTHKTDNIIEHIKFVKRIQDPIDANKQSLISKIPPPHDRIEHRKLDPIDKTPNTHDNVLNKVEDSWKDQIESPKFLSTSKSVNSAEMNEINIEYDTVMENGIPKRLQKPINTDIEEEENNTIVNYINNDLDNVTLFLKDIDGTGFSIGINRYVGEPPDKESMKMFNGIENLIKEYHQSYDQEISNESDIDKDYFANLMDKEAKRNERNGHKIHRRSTDKVKFQDFNRFFTDILNFKKYLETIKDSYNSTLIKPENITSITNNKNIITLLKKLKIAKIPDTMNKNLKTPQRLVSANPTNRNKRSFVVKKISSVKTKIKLNRFINTNTMANKKIFLKNKRHKRQINRIRIIAKDQKESPQNSDENIFIVSRENAYSDKATVKELGMPETVIDVNNQDHYDDMYPVENMYRINQNEQYMYSDLYDTKSSGRLMSKYPHIFFNADSGSQEEKMFTHGNVYDNSEKPYRIQPKSNYMKEQNVKMDTNPIVTSEKNIPNVEEIINAIMPPSSRAKYKLTLKITPKNVTKINTGFKEVHTSVNKSFDENGLRYFSLFNLSQISKVEKLNKTVDLKPEKRTTIKPLVNNQLKDQQRQIKTLLQLHKKRVDQQLGNLLTESKHLEKMIEANSRNNINKAMNILYDDIITTDTPSNDKMNKILASIKNLQESYNSIKNNIKTEPTTATEKLKISTDKSEILKYNEKVTNEILKRIDTNTNILKAFLQRFSDSLKPKVDVTRITTQNSGEIKINTKDWKSYNKSVFYGPNESINGTIPFIYAYQQNKGPLANMLYHGHIHTNNIQKDNKTNKPASEIKPDIIEKSNITRRKFNGSKFFMDDMENYFKLAPEPLTPAKMKNNITKV